MVSGGKKCGLLADRKSSLNYGVANGYAHQTKELVSSISGVKWSKIKLPMQFEDAVYTRIYSFGTENSVS